MATITVSPETNAQLKQFAAEKGCTTDEACERLVNTAIGRISAVRKYAKEHAAKTVKAPKDKAAPKAKAAPVKAKAKAAPKAKAPKAKLAPAATA